MSHSIDYKSLFPRSNNRFTGERQKRFEIPEKLEDQIVEYLQNHVEPTSDFLCFVLEGDLYEAVTESSAEEFGVLKMIVQYLDDHAPDESYSCSENVIRWTVGKGECRIVEVTEKENGSNGKTDLRWVEGGS